MLVNTALPHLKETDRKRTVVFQSVNINIASVDMGYQQHRAAPRDLDVDVLGDDVVVYRLVEQCTGERAIANEIPPARQRRRGACGSELLRGEGVFVTLRLRSCGVEEAPERAKSL